VETQARDRFAGAARSAVFGLGGRPDHRGPAASRACFASEASSDAEWYRLPIPIIR